MVILSFLLVTRWYILVVKLVIIFRFNYWSVFFILLARKESGNGWPSAKEATIWSLIVVEFLENQCRIIVKRLRARNDIIVHLLVRRLPKVLAVKLASSSSGILWAQAPIIIVIDTPESECVCFLLVFKGGLAQIFKLLWSYLLNLCFSVLLNYAIVINRWSTPELIMAAKIIIVLSIIGRVRLLLDMGWHISSHHDALHEVIVVYL